MSRVALWEKYLPSKGDSLCKGPEVSVLVCLRNSEEASIVRTGCTVGRGAGDEVGETTGPGWPLEAADASKLGVVVFRQPRALWMNQVFKQLSGCCVEDSLEVAKVEAGRQVRRPPP